MSDIGDMVVMGIWLHIAGLLVLLFALCAGLVVVYSLTSPWNICLSVGAWEGCI